LPRLVVIADVSVEQTGGGALQLYRLLGAYPAERLRVVHNPAFPLSDQARRLPGVTYQPHAYRIPRLVRNRLDPFWPALAALRMQRHAPAVAEELREFAPEAVLTVSHEYLWFTAAAVARRLRLPLHLILHDDWPSLQTAYQSTPVRKVVRWACRRLMGRVYRQAVSRLCVSPGMEEHCRRWFGAAGTVFYPARGDDSPSPQVRVRPVAGGPPVVAFVGNVHQGSTPDLLRKLAAVLASLNGHLDLYTILTADRLAALGMAPPTVRVPSHFPSAAEMNDRIGRTAHALVLPAAFDPCEREDVVTLFPSKLADYTALGLPVLVWGPSYSSAARWARENPGAALLFTDPDPAPVRDALLRLTTDTGHAVRLAAAAVEAGQRYFEPAAARRALYTALTAGCAATRP
jgi:hypothetical protein